MATEERTINVAGMSCGQCEHTLRSFLLEVDGIEAADPDHRAGSVLLRYEPGAASDDDIEEKIREAGFEPIASR